MYRRLLYAWSMLCGSNYANEFEASQLHQLIIKIPLTHIERKSAPQSTGYANYPAVKYHALCQIYLEGQVHLRNCNP
jgi:hypothetical protein